MANDRDDDADQDSNRRGEETSGGKHVTDTLRKLLTAGVSAAFMTEESIRGFVSELKLPKETMNLLMQGASKSKDELMNRVSREVIGIISKIDFVKEASRFVEEHKFKFKIDAEIDVVRKEPGASVETSKEGTSDAGSKSELNVQVRRKD